MSIGYDCQVSTYSYQVHDHEGRLRFSTELARSFQWSGRMASRWKEENESASVPKAINKQNYA